jgi:hypothetical protein
MMTEARIGPDLANWKDFAYQAFTINFAAYGIGPGPKVVAAAREFIVEVIEIPRVGNRRRASGTGRFNRVSGRPDQGVLIHIHKLLSLSQEINNEHTRCPFTDSSAHSADLRATTSRKW